MIKRMLSMVLMLMMLVSCTVAQGTEADEQPGMPSGTPPQMPLGEGVGGEPPQKPEGGMPGDPPSGAPGTMGDPQGEPPAKPEGQHPDGMPDGMPGGMQGTPETYAALYTVTEDTTLSGDMASGGVDENVIHVQSGTVMIEDATVTRQSSESTGGDASSFYGIGAAVLATGGSVVMNNSTIATDAAGGAGIFAYGDGVVYASDTTITTQQNTSGGIHVAGGGTLYARNLQVTTEGESAAAIRSDRGSGTMVVDGGSYTSNGVGSPAVYVTADISIHDADLRATGSEALCMEGLNTVRLFDCDLSGDMDDLAQNDNTWTVIVYQSMSGDAQVGKGRFEMTGGTLDSANGGLFYTTNTESEFILNGVDIVAAQDSEYFLRCTGNANQRGWGQSGSNGASCTFTGLNQLMQGDVQWDSISTLEMSIAQGSRLTGAVVNDESCAGQGGEGYCNLYIDSSSTWIVTGDSTLTNLHCAGTLTDPQGNTVTIAAADGTILSEGDSDYTVTVSGVYSQTYDNAQEGSVSIWEDYAVDF